MYFIQLIIWYLFNPVQVSLLLHCQWYFLSPHFFYFKQFFQKLKKKTKKKKNHIIDIPKQHMDICT